MGGHAAIVLLVVVSSAALGFVQAYAATTAVERLRARVSVHARVRAAPVEFRTAWFVESLLTELVVALVVRTRRPFFRSRPGRWLWVSSLLVAGIAVALPYLPIGRPLGLTPLPPALVGILILIAGLYVTAAEGTKRFFYSRLHPE
ncbi:MAG: cation transporting ATPase C-terminal domain-containing protein [Anaerolineales bacterium]